MSEPAMTSLPADVAHEPPDAEQLVSRGTTLHHQKAVSSDRAVEQLLIGLLAVEWLLGVFAARHSAASAWPFTVSGHIGKTLLGLGLGALLSGTGILVGLARPGRPGNRHVLAVCQMLWSGVFLQLSSAEPAAHLHVYISVLVLGMYRDTNVVALATMVAISDQLLRGLFWPESVYGQHETSVSQFLSSTGWALAEAAILSFATLRNNRERAALHLQTVTLEAQLDAAVDKGSRRGRELDVVREQYRMLVENSRTVPIQLDAVTWAVSFVAPQVRQLLGCAPVKWGEPDFLVSRMHPDDQDGARQSLRRAVNLQVEPDVEFRLKREDGQWAWLRLIVNLTAGSVVHGVLLDVTQRRQLEIDLAQAQKLESVGRLASGIAHELNTPIQFVGDSIHFIRDAFGDTLALLESYRRVAGDGETVISDAHRTELAAQEEQADIGYVIENVPKALDRSVDGLARVASIVRSMKEFAHPDQRQKMSADLNHAITTTLTIARNEYKYVADVDTEFGQIPPVFCHVNELNQVFLNLIVNAAHAIEDVVKGTSQRGHIRIRTWKENDEVVIALADTGMGIPESIRGQVFDPFFTTKGVGKGTGQGLSIARSVVVDKHGGKLSFESETGKGTTFFIRLPVNVPAAARLAGPAAVQSLPAGASPAAAA